MTFTMSRRNVPWEQKCPNAGQFETHEDEENRVLSPEEASKESPTIERTDNHGIAPQQCWKWAGSLIIEVISPTVESRVILRLSSLI